MELQAGFEPATCSLQGSCTAAVLLKRFRSRYEDRTRMGRLKICNPDLLDEPTEQREPSNLFGWPSREGGRPKANRPSWEFDRFRTCDHQSHNLALCQLSYKLHITCSRWIRTTTSRTGIWYATITPWSSVAPEGVEPSPTEPKPVVLPLYHRAIILWNFVESNHILRIFSPAHKPTLQSLLYRDS